MRLFLGSQDFGEFASELRRLAGENRKVLMLTNARDYRSEEYIQELILRKQELFRENGFEAEALDLRAYFGQQEALEQFLEEKKPSTIAALGGNVFLLATALRLSGMDELLRKHLSRDEIVYAGSSAGAMVAAHDLRVYDYASSPEDSAAEVSRIYNVEPVFEGLGLIDEHIVPHANLTDLAQRRAFYLRNIDKSGRKATVLTDADVYLVNGAQTKTLRGDD